MEWCELKKAVESGNIEYRKAHKRGKHYRPDDLFVFEEIFAEQRFLIVSSGKNVDELSQDDSGKSDRCRPSV